MTAFPKALPAPGGTLPRAPVSGWPQEGEPSMTRFLLALLAALVASAVLFASIAWASILKRPVARQAVSNKADHACAGTCDASGAKKCMRLSSKKVSCTAYVRRASQVCTDKMIVTRTSGGGLKVKSDPYPSGWACVD